ncbi:MAG: hypothetical protein V1793_17300 [Pseudomonadota bacterium]
MKIETNFYTITAYENLVCTEFFSSWDETVVQNFVKDLRAIGLQLYTDKAWAILSDRTKWYLYTPEAEKLLIEAATSVKTKLTHYAVVTGPEHRAVKKWQSNEIIKNGVVFEVKFFEKVKDAEEWLASFGYRMTPLAVESKSLG